LGLSPGVPEWRPQPDTQIAKSTFFYGPIMTDLFNDSDDTPEVDPNKDHFSELVGEGKKYKDSQAAGRALVEKDAFIERLKTEAHGLRQELNTRLKLEEVIDRISSASKSPTSEQPPREPDKEQSASQLSPEDVQKLVADTLTDTEKKTQARRNLAFVEEKLQEAFGPTFRRTVKAQAAKLQVGESFLQNLAAEQPAAFLKLMEVEGREHSSVTPPPAPSVNSAALGFKPNSGIKRKSYFDSIKKQDPRRYWSVAVQNELHAEALKQGQTFFD
jgi:hypothetical protein